jgi:hypothetical protein
MFDVSNTILLQPYNFDVIDTEKALAWKKMMCKLTPKGANGHICPQHIL